MVRVANLALAAPISFGFPEAECWAAPVAAVPKRLIDALQTVKRDLPDSHRNHFGPEAVQAYNPQPTGTAR